MQTTQGIHRAVQIRPAALATIYGERRRSWAEHRDRVARFAAGLSQLGVESQDRVAIIANNSDLYLEAVHAIAWAGAVVVPGNFRWAEREHAEALMDCEPRVLIVDPQFAEMGERLAQACAPVRLLVLDAESSAGGHARRTEDLIAAHDPIEDRCASGNALSGIYYTGGTTGRSKGVMLSHQGLMINALAVAGMAGVPMEPVFLHSAPLFHVAGASTALGVTLTAGAHVILPSFTPAAAVAAIAAEKVTMALLVPTMFGMLREYLSEHPADLSSVRRIRYGASPISESLLRDAMRMFPNAEFQQGYGQTELSPTITVLEPRFHLEAGGKYLRSAGRPLLGVDVRIVDEQLHDLPRGVVGEIVVRSPGAMLGYWNQPELTRRTLVDGWVRTGDAGHMDDDGFVFIADRLKDMIISGGENVFSAEVESALAAHADVAECAVIGVPDPKWGERVHAIVRLQPGATAGADELIQHCRTLIAGYKCPRSLEFRDTPLPLSAQGKVLKADLRRPHWDAVERQVG